VGSGRSEALSLISERRSPPQDDAVTRGWYRASLLVSDTTLETPDALDPEGRQAAQPSSRRGARPPFWRRHVWWLVAVGIVVLAEILLRWANTRPGYDPYGWLIWGYQTLRGTLDLGGAPSWKPFTFIFNVPYALFGHYALHLWMLTAVSVSLAGAVFGGRIAYRLTAVEGGRRWPPIVAAIIGGACVLGIQQYIHYVLSSQSDSMLVTVCLAAIDMFLIGRLAWAWWLGVLAGLGRPEVWAFTAIYGIWILWKRPSMRWMVVAGAVVTAFLWFGIPWITNGKPNVAGQLALKSPRELHKNKIVGTIDRFISLQVLPVWIAALVAVGLAALRRNRVVLMLAGMVALWVVVEIAFVLHGFPGVQRYLFEASALAGVLAGVAAGWLLQDTSRSHRSIPSWVGIPLVAVFVLVLLPDARAAWDTEHKDLRHERLRTERILQLGSYITALGGPGRIQACGGALLNVEYVSIAGWYLHKNTGQIAYQPDKVLKRTNPIVYFILLRNGWMVQPLRPQSATGKGCASLKSLYVPTARHPQGVLIPK
jgi:hypothetical protein